MSFQQIVQEHFTVANGYEKDSNIVHADRDSVMINMGTKNMEQVEKFMLDKFNIAGPGEVVNVPSKKNYTNVFSKKIYTSKNEASNDENETSELEKLFDQNETKKY